MHRPSRRKNRRRRHPADRRGRLRGERWLCPSGDRSPSQSPNRWIFPGAMRLLNLRSFRRRAGTSIALGSFACERADHAYPNPSPAWTTIPSLPFDHDANGPCTVTESGFLYVTDSGTRMARIALL
jgi:hypothetical protein